MEPLTMEPSRKSSSRRSNARRSSARIHDLAITILEDGTIDMMPAVDMDPAAAVYFEKGAEVLLGKEIPVTTPPPAKDPPKSTKSTRSDKSRLAVLLKEQDWFSIYKRFAAISFLTNVVLFSVAVSGHWPCARDNAALLSLANVVVLSLCRNEVFLRMVFWLTVLLFGHSWVPLRLKLWITHALQNLGGIHAGCGVASLLWAVYALAWLAEHIHRVPKSSVAILSVVFVLLLICCLAACPLVRHVHHNVFENAHRLCGWAALGLIWAFIVISATYDPFTGDFYTNGDRIVRRVDIWFAAGLTVVIFLPWTLIRRVPVRASSPDESVSLITFPDGLPVGVLGRIARNPLKEWHAFGIGSDGFSKNIMICGAVGDFTKRLVTHPPTHLWTRTVRFAGVAYLANMYKRAVFVGTGSGLGPFLSFIMQPSKVDVHLIWIAKDIPKAYGRKITKILDRYDGSITP
uniref:Uncharacterized protein n=1 Tax=Physcomitrium patens TaxID=3218 RepID=A0A2K1JQK4_PHYPA|nr:adenylate-forming reductase 03009-like [Physcomitrium patens]PNR43819.1 hypothetical protein PHYPA_016202 [Physcomitrium patens]|eukprot:XP_024390480.1 adenylate-forming reductase 03009-like [Physcomitrella patens]